MESSRRSTTGAMARDVGKFLRAERVADTRTRISAAELGVPHHIRDEDRTSTSESRRRSARLGSTSGHRRPHVATAFNEPDRGQTAVGPDGIDNCTMQYCAMKWRTFAVYTEGFAPVNQSSQSQPRRQLSLLSRAIRS